MVLTKQKFKEHMKLYPEQMETFRNRIEQRFEQSELLLTLCEKHNLYPLAFAKIQDRIRRSEDVHANVVDNVATLIPTESTTNTIDGPKNYKNYRELGKYSIFYRMRRGLPTFMGNYNF
jgi:hypothetical protein